jgi:single-strand DNA-binding protein
MNLNQLTIIGFIGRNAETKQLPNGTSVIKFVSFRQACMKQGEVSW